MAAPNSNERLSSHLLESYYDYLLKFILIGPSGCGKSCLLHRFVKDEWMSVSSHTVGVEFANKIIKVGTLSRRKRLKLQLWDTAGQERFRSVTRSYYRGAASALLVYDITSRESFLSLSTWLSDIRALASPQIAIILVGNKIDQSSEREVSVEEAGRWADRNNLEFVEVSALTGVGVDNVFHRAAGKVLTKIELGEIDPGNNSSGIQFGDSQWAGNSYTSLNSFNTLRGRSMTQGSWWSEMEEFVHGGDVRGRSRRRNICC